MQYCFQYSFIIILLLLLFFYIDELCLLSFFLVTLSRGLSILSFFFFSKSKVLILFIFLYQISLTFSSNFYYFFPFTWVRLKLLLFLCFPKVEVQVDFLPLELYHDPLCEYSIVSRPFAFPCRFQHFHTDFSIIVSIEKKKKKTYILDCIESVFRRVVHL